MTSELRKITLRPTRGWVAIDFRELLRFKDLLFEFANRDVKLRYKQTALGIAWVVLQPLLAAGLLYFAFRIVAGIEAPQGTSFFLFSFAGLLAWNIFSWTLSKTGLSMVGNSYLVSKVYFPRLILPLSGAISTLIDFAVSFCVMLVLLGVYGVWPGPQILLLPVWILLMLCLAMGAGLIAAALTVDYRDVQHILPFLIPFMLYASPVAYDVSQISPRYQAAFYLLNPLAPLIAGFRWSILGTTPPPPMVYIIWSAALSLGLFMIGAAVFRRTERKFADVI
jgi:lipopolysaccharide transport system permease protein